MSTKSDAVIYARYLTYLLGISMTISLPKAYSMNGLFYYLLIVSSF
ncbi:hypothetical protein GAPWK_2734 [Gilliamella apicola]|nr:hypothetical protein GAPWK_2734 [Gilliamella apicola]